MEFEIDFDLWNIWNDINWKSKSQNYSFQLFIKFDLPDSKAELLESSGSDFVCFFFAFSIACLDSSVSPDVLRLIAGEFWRLGRLNRFPKRLFGLSVFSLGRILTPESRNGDGLESVPSTSIIGGGWVNDSTKDFLASANLRCQFIASIDCNASIFRFLLCWRTFRIN